MQMSVTGVKPRITEPRKLREIVTRLKLEGAEPDEIQRHLVAVAVVDLDELNAVLRAA
jgi:hypothetical protein